MPATPIKNCWVA